MVRVLVAGLPCSGNWMTVNHLLRCGFEARLNHARHADLWKNDLEWCDVIVMPIRTCGPEWKECLKRKKQEWCLDRDLLLPRLLNILSAGNFDIHYVRFEDILLTHGEALNDLVSSLGGTPKAFPRDVVERNISEGRILTESERREYRKTHTHND